MGLSPRYSFSGNICFEFSVFCICNADVNSLPTVLQKEKEQKKLQQLQTSLWSLAAPLPPATPHAHLVGTPLRAGGTDQLTQLSQLSQLPIHLLSQDPQQQLQQQQQQLQLQQQQLQQQLMIQCPDFLTSQLSQLAVPNQTIPTYSLPYLQALSGLGKFMFTPRICIVSKHLTANIYMYAAKWR